MATVSVVSKVKSDTDDGYITLGAYNYFGTWYASNTYGYFDSGQVTNKGGCSAYTNMGIISWYMPFWRFDQVDVPQGATITSAKLRLKRSTWTDSDGYPDLKSSFHIKMLATDNAHKQITNLPESGQTSPAYRYARASSTYPYPSEPTYPGIPNGFVQTSPTVFGSNSVLWDVSAGSTTIDTWVDSPDITDLVKEVVDRAGWVADNAMCIYFCLPDIPQDADNDTTGWVREFHSYGATGTPAAELHIEFDHKSSTPEVVHIPARPVATSPASAVTSLGGGAPVVPGVDPPDRVAGLQTWYSAESLSSSLVDGDSVTSWSTKAGQTLDLNAASIDKPTYEDDVAAYPVVDLVGTAANYGLINTTTDSRFLCPGANEAMITAVHWRPTDINDVNFIQVVGYGSGTKNTGASGFRGWDWIPVGSNGEMRFRARGSDDALLELNFGKHGGELEVDEDYIMLVVRDMASQQFRLFINGGNKYAAVDCLNSVDFKHSTDDAEICVGNYVGAGNLDSAAKGYTGDLLTYVRDTDFTANEINSIGSYLAQRYGVLWNTVHQAGASPTLGYTTGLAAHYKAVDDGVGTYMTLNGTDVDVWKDVSGNGRDLYPYDQHGVTPDPPTFDADGWTGTIDFNNKTFATNVGGMRTSCVDFAGVECMQEDASTDVDIDVPYTIIAVAQPPEDYASRHQLFTMYWSSRGCLDTSTVSARKWWIRNGSYVTVNEYVRPTAYLTDLSPFNYRSQGAFSIAVVYGDGANSKFYDNGVVEQSTLDCGTETAKRIRLGGGQQANDRRPWHGKIAEVLIYDHEVSAANIKAIHDDYLSKEWGVRPPSTDYNDV